MKKYHFGVKLQSRELNLVLKKLRDRYHLQNGSFRKRAVWTSKHFGKISQNYSSGNIPHQWRFQ